MIVVIFQFVFYDEWENGEVERKTVWFILHFPFSIFNYLIAFTMSSRILIASARAASL